MSIYASFLLLPDLVVRYAVWTNSHTEMVDALGLPDDKLGSERRFLRAVAKGGDIDNFVPDEDDRDRLPTWYTDNENGYHEAARRALAQMNEYSAKYGVLWDECRAKRNALWTEYWVKCDVLWTEYDNKRDARRECQAKRDALLAEYDAKNDVIWLECTAKRNALWEEYSALPGAIPKPKNRV